MHRRAVFDVLPGDMLLQMPRGRELVLRKDGAVEFHGPELFPLMVVRFHFEMFSPPVSYFDGPVVKVYRHPDEPRGAIHLTLREPTTGSVFERRFPVISMEQL